MPRAPCLAPRSSSAWPTRASPSALRHRARHDHPRTGPAQRLRHRASRESRTGPRSASRRHRGRHGRCGRCGQSFGAAWRRCGCERVSGCSQRLDGKNELGGEAGEERARLGDDALDAVVVLDLDVLPCRSKREGSVYVSYVSSRDSGKHRTLPSSDTQQKQAIVARTAVHRRRARPSAGGTRMARLD